MDCFGSTNPQPHGAEARAQRIEAEAAMAGFAEELEIFVQPSSFSKTLVVHAASQDQRMWGGIPS